MHSYIRTALVIGAIGFTVACGQKGAKLQKSVVPPDKTLFETGQEYLGKSQYIKARLAFQTLINTYPDSELSADSYMAIGDSFYDEGGTENLLQAEDQYKNFIVFFPTNPKAVDAQFKVFSLNRKMMRAPDRDQTYAVKAEAAAKRLIELFPDSPYAEIAKTELREVQEVLAKGNHMVGSYYFDKGNFRGAEGRYDYVVKRYQDYSELDDVLFRRAQSLEKIEKTDDAAASYAKIAQAYPFSRHFEEAKASLERLGKPIPAVDQALAAENQKKVKPEQGFNILWPVTEFLGALGFAGPPDPYKVAQRRVAEMAEAQAAAQAEAAAGNGAQSDVAIQATLKKDASGATEVETVLGPAASKEAAASAKSDPKKKNNKGREKKPGGK